MSKLSISAIGLMATTILSKILGFGRELTLSYFYGTGMYSDAYISALNIPGVIFACIGVAISTSFIPLYSGIKEKECENKANLFMNNVLNIVTVIVLVITILGIVFSKQIVQVFAIGFTGEKLSITIEFAKILFLGSIFLELSNILSSYLQIKGNFIIPGIIAIPYNIIIMISIFLAAKYNNYIIVYGTVFAMIVQVVFQLPYVYKNGFKYKTYINIKDSHIKEMIFLVAPVFIGVAVNQVNALIDKTLASTLSSGSIAALNYANKLNGFILALFVMSIATVIYPLFYKYISQNNLKEFKELINSVINIMLVILIPTTVGTMVLSKPIVKILFERGAFDSYSTKVTSIALFFYSLGIVGFGLREILVRAFYSLKDTKTPMLNGVISVILNIILNLTLIKSMGISGLALATSISSIIGVFILMICLNKKIKFIDYVKISKLTIKVIISSIVMGIGVNMSYKYLIILLGSGLTSIIASLTISVIIGIIVYFVLIYILRLEEVYILIDKIKSRIANR